MMLKHLEWLQRRSVSAETSLEERSHERESVEVDIAMAYDEGQMQAYDDAAKHLESQLPLHDHVGNARGTYVGDDVNFKHKFALIQTSACATVVYAQFNEGPLWMTHSWLTFRASDWDYERDQE